MYIDTAFYRNIQYRATIAGEPVNDYQIIDHGKKPVNDKILRYKISHNPEIGYSIIYYVMKDDYSNILYEFKTVSLSESSLTTHQEFLEGIVVSSGFDNK